MKRGDIYYANLSPVMVSEMGKRRPVLIISNDISNSAATTVTILPLTSNVSRVYPFEVLLNPENSFYINIEMLSNLLHTHPCL
jgi:mRNA interferase MazF